MNMSHSLLNIKYLILIIGLTSKSMINCDFIRIMIKIFKSCKTSLLTIKI